ncbi:MAG: hypothetical protein J6T10_30655 [Methanobrevibacter sp.]|nr:hypothetical protein [Methanobrevibacter sp.]
MAYITPNTVVKVLKGIPLDKDYNHTLFNASLNAQESAISAYTKYTFTAQTYQRAGKNKIRVARLADDLYDCNYMMFQNTSYGNKWFYAFIDTITYINDNATEIEYTIDVMQTWYFDYALGSCFVEREHTLTDHIGENLVNEDFDTGELIPQNTWEFKFPISQATPRYTILIFYVPNRDTTMDMRQMRTMTQEDLDKYGKYIDHMEDNVIDQTLTPVGASICQSVPVSGSSSNHLKFYDGMILNGIFMGCKYVALPILLDSAMDYTVTKIDTIINSIIAEPVRGSIVNIVQVPTDVYLQWRDNPSDTPNPWLNEQEYTRRNYSANHQTFYQAKNNKIYTFPFKSLIISNNCGQTATYKWEYFAYKNTQGTAYKAQFNIEGVPLISPEVMCYPINYRGLQKDYESGLVINDFPQCAWSEDSFAKWWAQNKEAYVTSLVSSAVTMAAGTTLSIASGNVMPAVSSYLGGASKIASTLAEKQTQKNAPDTVSGQVNASSLRTVQDRIGYKFYDMGLPAEKAQVIDNYFDMFGYAIKSIKVPNVKSGNVTLRPHWNYIKTGTCIIHAETNKGLPSDDEEKIAKIYNNGITFWLNISEIGDYRLNNAPTTP